MDLALSVEEESLLEEIKTDLAEIGDDRSKLIPILQLIQQKTCLSSRRGHLSGGRPFKHLFFRSLRGCHFL